MATWVTHLMVADNVIQQISSLSKHEFFVGNIAADCNVENEDWTSFTPSREITHWMSDDRKVAADCDRFLQEYVDKRSKLDDKERSFLLGYYAHLITDAEFQRYIRDEERVRNSWERIKNHPELGKLSAGMEETWDSVKILIKGKERMKDIYYLEKEYLDSHPESGYLTDIIGLTEFPDFIEYLPKGAIVRKVNVMGYMPKKEISQYPYIAMTVEEYNYFLNTATKLVVEAINKYMQKTGDKVSLLETTQNTRDLGGYQKADGTYTSELSIIRSDVQNYPSEKDILFLKKYKIKTIIDLRGENDVVRKPSGFADAKGFRYYNFQIDEGSGVPKYYEAVPLSYMKIAEAKAMPDVFRCIANATDGVMFNCTAGKDRTGVVSAILLCHVGVRDKDIVQDYVLTKVYGKERLELIHKNFPDIDMRIVTPCEFFMEEFLHLFREKYGNTTEYFKTLGLADVEIERIGNKL